MKDTSGKKSHNYYYWSEESQCMIEVNKHEQ